MSRPPGVSVKVTVPIEAPMPVALIEFTVALRGRRRSTGDGDRKETARYQNGESKFVHVWAHLRRG